MKKGYTFVEIMVVVALLGILLIGIIGLFLTNLKLSGKATALARVKEEGDFSSSTIERLLRYSTKITDISGSSSICTADGNPQQNEILFTDANGTHHLFLNGTHQLVINDGTDRELTSIKVDVSPVTFSIKCVTTPGGLLMIMSYDITDVNDTAITETYTSRVVLRNKP